MNVLQTIVGGLVLIALVTAGIFAIGVLGAAHARAAATAAPPGDSTGSGTTTTREKNNERID